VPGGGLPDAAAVIGAIEGCTGRPVEVVVGKPSPITVRAILDRLRLPASECIIIGDRLETDIRMGREAGMATAVTLTGVTTPELLAGSDIQPDYVLRRLDELLASLQASSQASSQTSFQTSSQTSSQ
jgi:arabinose operon protein AraL